MKPRLFPVTAQDDDDDDEVVSSADLGLSISTPTGDGQRWGGGQRGVEWGRRRWWKGARKVRISNWEGKWRQSNEETCVHTLRHKHTSTRVSQTAARRHGSKCTLLLSTCSNGHTQNWRTEKRRQEKTWGMVATPVRTWEDEKKKDEGEDSKSKR